MTASFRISEDDYAAAMKLFARLTPQRWALLAGLSAVLLLGALFGGPLGWPVAVGGLVGAGIVVGGAFVLAPMTARRHYRKYKGMHAEFSAQLLDTGLRLRSPHGENTIVWENVLKWRQNDRFVLIYVMPRLFHVLPKSVAAQGFELPRLLEQLRQRVGPEV